MKLAQILKHGEELKAIARSKAHRGFNHAEATDRALELVEHAEHGHHAIARPHGAINKNPACQPEPVGEVAAQILALQDEKADNRLARHVLRLKRGKAQAIGNAAIADSLQAHIGRGHHGMNVAVSYDDLQWKTPWMNVTPSQSS